jgi:hypothetical protein
LQVLTGRVERGLEQVAAVAQRVATYEQQGMALEAQLERHQRRLAELNASVQGQQAVLC